MAAYILSDMKAAKLIVENGEEHNDLIHFIYNCLLVQNWRITDYSSWNFPAWSISVEWFNYLIFPIIALSMSKVKKPIYSLLLIVIVTTLLLLLFTEAERKDFIKFGLYKGIFEFFIGVCLFNLYRKDFLKNFKWDFVCILAFSSIVALSILGTSDSILVILFIILVYSLANVSGFANKVFSCRPLFYLGEISYSIYLIHIPFRDLFAVNLDLNFYSAPLFSIAFTFVIMMTLIGLSHLTYTLVERPARGYIREKIGKA